MPAYSAELDPPAPVARVEVSGPGGTRVDVPMLLDSGADTSIVPREVAEQIGAPVAASAFELEFFDGTRAAAEETHISLRLERFTFAGTYLVEDREYGILGRNVLQHVTLRLDGPRQTWSLVQD